MSQQRSNRPHSGIRLPLWGLGLIILLILTLLAISSIWLFNTVQQMASTLEIVNPEFSNVTRPTPIAPNIVVTSPAQDNTPNNVFPINTDSLTAWTGHDRVNILLLGIDQRCDEIGPTRTDSMMVVSLDPVTPAATVLSIPRDLWVDIPGFDVNRINQAHYLGESHEYPGGGPVLAMRTVEATLGIVVKYYVTLNFDAFTEFVDTLGGIDINVPEEINDETYPDRCYGYDPFFISAGPHHLNGDLALKYARTRATFLSDIDRAGRQQQVGLAIREKALSLNILSQIPELWHNFENNVRTNMQPEEAIQLALLAQKISTENIKTAVIDYNYVYNETTPDGQLVLIPVRENIRHLRDELFAPPVIPTPIIEDLPALMLQESSRVALYNGTPVFGLAGATETYLAPFNFTITKIGNADAANYTDTQIIDYGNHPNTTHYLAQIMHVRPLNIIYNSQETPEEYDILVIIGNSWSIPEP